MKTSIKNSLVVMAMLGVITSYANLVPSETVLKEDPKTTQISLSSMRAGQRLLIKSSNGTILYKESISKSGQYRKAFDLTSLPDGDYFFEVDKDYEIKMIPFSVMGAQVTFIKGDEKSIFKPVVTNKSNVVSISKLCLNSEPTQIEIYFDNGDYELIHSELVTETQKIERVYKLRQNVKGNYKVVCKTEGRVFVNYIKV